ncbi:MAG: hypothetical protein AAGA75_25085 [Cyanobacteria bacterium P01_E01_bin.6]
MVDPYLGVNELTVLPAHQHNLKVELFLKPPLFATYSPAFIEQAPPQYQSLFYKWVNQVHYYHHGHDASSPQAAFKDILSGAIALPNTLSIDQLLAQSEFLSWEHLMRRPMLPEMQLVIHQILSCPYTGRIRRAYLESKALELLALQLNALTQPQSPSHP